MKTKTRLLIYPALLMGVLLVVTSSCKKWDDPKFENSILFNPDLTYGTMTDQDSNVYKTITIGTQTWMAENLKVTKYRNGDPIPNVTDGTAWLNLTTGACCDYENTPGFSKICGRLYNWYAVNDSRNIAPTGWHVPSDAEWTKLTNYLGGEDVASGKLKESGTNHWKIPNTDATNESGFTGLPGGYRDTDGSFIGQSLGGHWWSTTQDDASYAWGRGLKYYNANVRRGNYNRSYGFSVRCLKDN